MDLVKANFIAAYKRKYLLTPHLMVWPYNSVMDTCNVEYFWICLCVPIRDEGDSVLYLTPNTLEKYLQHDYGHIQKKCDEAGIEVMMYPYIGEDSRYLFKGEEQARMFADLICEEAHNHIARRK